MQFDTILILGSGQIGKEVIRRLLAYKPKTVIVHNLRKQETDASVEYLEKFNKGTSFIKSYGDAFMPYNLNKCDTTAEKLAHKDELLEFFYSDLSEDVLKQSTLYNLVSLYKPDAIIDAMNSGTTLGSHFDPDAIKHAVSQKDRLGTAFVTHLLNDFAPKAINFVLSLKLAMEDFKVKKFLKVSTTGLGGMGMNMPYTHGDTPKSSLSYALMGKISASGTLHQLLWRLASDVDLDISLIIPSTYVGYDSAMFEPIETDMGLIKKFDKFESKELRLGEKLSYAAGDISDEYLTFPVVRAGENHVYSLYELDALTAIGQMEAITKEEVANTVIEDLFGKRRRNMLYEMDKASLGPTYAGHAMAEHSKDELKTLMEANHVNSIATGNLGATTAKYLYELYLIKTVCPTVDVLRNTSVSDIYSSICEYLKENNSDIVTEMVSLGLPVVTSSNNVYIGKYTLYPSSKDDQVVTDENLETWIRTAWVDIRETSIEKWRDIIIQSYEDASKFSSDVTMKLNRDINAITNDYNIGQILAYHLNMHEKGRKRSEV